jgi:hypothetical protein
MDMWEGGIRATGGALNPSKSYWYMIDFKWIPQKLRWDYKNKEEVIGEIKVRNPQNEREILERLEVNDPRVTLGINVAPDGTWKGQVEYLLEKVNKWVSRLKSGHLNQIDTWYALTRTIMKTLEYPMVAISLTRAQWNKVMSPLLQAVLPRIGMSHNFPHKVIYAPLSRNGLGLVHPYDNQHLQQLQTVLRHGDRHSPTGQLLRASFEQMQLEIGTSEPFLSLPFHTYGGLATHCWISHLWEYLSENGITLQPGASPIQLQHAHNTWTTEPTHQGLVPSTDSDIFIMNLFVQHGYKTDDLFALNVCRMYLHAVTFSDLVTADGLFLTNSAWNGKRDGTRSSRYRWPRTQRPGNNTWQLWQTALQKTALVRQNSDLRLRLAIGHWSNDHANWKWFTDDSTTSLYYREGHRWRQFVSRTARTSRCRQYHSNTLVGTLPEPLVRVTVEKISSRTVTITGKGQETASPITNKLFSTFADVIRQHRKTREGWCLEIVRGSTSDLTSIIRALATNSLCIVSDGSYKTGISTAACILTYPGAKRTIQVRCRIPGEAMFQDSYRGELGGIFAAIVVTELLRKFSGILTANVEIGCDGQEALKNAFDNFPLHPGQSQYDLLSAIHQRRHYSPLTWTYRHVRGHQGLIIGHHLSWWEELNEDMDRAAKEHWADTHALNRPTAPSLSTFEGWHVLYQNRKVSRVQVDLLYEAIYTPITEEYWVTRNIIRASSKRRIYWDGIGAASAKLRPSKRRWMVKQTTEIYGYGKWMKRWKFWNHDRCPSCRQHEDIQHIARCTHAGANAVWESSMATLEAWFNQQETHPGVAHLLLARLNAWRYHQETRFPTPLIPTLKTAYLDQQEIGWFNFLQGRISTSWVTIQSDYYKLIDSRRSGATWARRLISHLWELSRKMWLHRNYILHEMPNAETEKLQRKLDRRITSQFQQNVDGLSTPHHYLLRRNTLSRVLKWPNHEKTAWLDTVTIARKAWCRRRTQARRQRQMVRDLIRIRRRTPSSTPINPNQTQPHPEEPHHLLPDSRYYSPPYKDTPAS